MQVKGEGSRLPGICRPGMCTHWIISSTPHKQRWKKGTRNVYGFLSTRAEEPSSGGLTFDFGLLALGVLRTERPSSLLSAVCYAFISPLSSAEPLCGDGWVKGRENVNKASAKVLPAANAWWEEKRFCRSVILARFGGFFQTGLSRDLV